MSRWVRARSVLILGCLYLLASPPPAAACLMTVPNLGLWDGIHDAQLIVAGKIVDVEVNELAVAFDHASVSAADLLYLLGAKVMLPTIDPLAALTIDVSATLKGGSRSRVTFRLEGIETEDTTGLSQPAVFFLHRQGRVWRWARYPIVYGSPGELADLRRLIGGRLCGLVRLAGVAAGLDARRSPGAGGGTDRRIGRGRAHGSPMCEDCTVSDDPNLHDSPSALAIALPLLWILPVFWIAGCDGSSPTAPRDAHQECLDRAVFGEPAASPYVLPYPAGTAFRVTQTYCDPIGGHFDDFAYDFELPTGAPVTAARSGNVTIANDQFSDSDFTEGHENNVFVEHADGTVARYTHLQQGSVLVEVGDQVDPGQEIGASGSSGNTGGFPHLHFAVFRNGSSFDGPSSSIPVNFRNAGGRLDDRGGLIRGEVYQALAF